MTLSTTATTVTYNGDNATTVFPFAYKVFEASHLVVVRKTISGGALTTLTLNTDYTVQGLRLSAGGSVTLPSPLSSAYQLIITRSTPKTQTTDLKNQGKFYPEIHEDALDKLTMLVQETTETITAVQPLDADLTAIASLTGTGGWAKRTGDGAWVISTPAASDVGADASGAAAAVLASSLQKASNLSDLTNAATARTNLGLGTAATQNSTAFDPAGAAASAQSASQPLNGLLSAISALATTGLLVIGAGGTVTTLVAGTANQVVGMNAAATALENKSILGTANQITVTHAAGLITLSLPQSIHTAATPMFAGLITPKIYPAADSTTAFGIFKADGTTAVVTVDTTNGFVQISSPSATPNWGLGFGETTMDTVNNHAGIRLSNYSNGNCYFDTKVYTSGYLAMRVGQGAALGSTTEYMRVYGTGIVAIPGGTASTSTTTGALTVAGGLSAQGAAWIGAGANISRNVADAATCLIVNQTHASSTGLILDAQFGGVSKFSVSANGTVQAVAIAGQALYTNLNILNQVGNTPILMGNQTMTVAVNGVVTDVPTFTNTSGASVVHRIVPTYNQASGTAANTDLLINRTQTAVGSGAQLLIDAQVGGVSKGSLSNTGLLTAQSMVSVAGFGCNGKTAQTAVTVNAASTDLATVIALCNQIRAALIADGIAA